MIQKKYKCSKEQQSYGRCLQILLVALLTICLVVPAGCMNEIAKDVSASKHSNQTTKVSFSTPSKTEVSSAFDSFTQVRLKKLAGKENLQLTPPTDAEMEAGLDPEAFSGISNYDALIAMIEDLSLIHI